MSLSSQIAIVTGGTRGIGRATCSFLAGLGAQVVVIGRNEADAQAVAKGDNLNYNLCPLLPSIQLSCFNIDLSTSVPAASLEKDWDWMESLAETDAPPPPRHFGLGCDVKDEESVKKTVDHIHKTLGVPSILVNAGMNRYAIVNQSM
jgi:NAD(P)-dependent dehydrogenase (short-subunit alcohol dehydrogenase family)